MKGKSSEDDHLKVEQSHSMKEGEMKSQPENERTPKALGRRLFCGEKSREIRELGDRGE
jgi:hypothetical protein